MILMAEDGTFAPMVSWKKMPATGDALFPNDVREGRVDAQLPSSFRRYGVSARAEAFGAGATSAGESLSSGGPRIYSLKSTKAGILPTLKQIPAA